MKSRKSISPKKRVAVSKEAVPKKAKKAVRLQKRLVVRIVVIAAVIAGLHFLTGMAEDQVKAAETEKDKAQADLSTVEREANGLKQQIANLGAAAQIYAGLLEKRTNMDFLIIPEEIRADLLRMKDKYFLDKLNLQFMEKEVLPLENVDKDLEAVRFTIRIELTGLSDMHIYRFYDELKQTFPGFIDPAELTVTQESELDLETLSKVGRGEAASTTSAFIRFFWYGFVFKAPEMQGS